MAKAKIKSEPIETQTEAQTEAQTETHVAKPNEAQEVKEKAPRAARARDTDLFTFLKDPAPDTRWAPQAQIILGHIRRNNEITRGKLISDLREDPTFTTRQPHERIVAYYQKDFVNAGIIRVTA